jgi:solute carrier family 25 protein 39/40
MSLPNTIIYFTTYEQLKCFMGYKRTNLNPILPGIAGGLARVLAVLVTSPLELIRTKKMSAKLSYTDLSKSLREAIKSDGLRTLWRGLVPTFWRDLPFSSKLYLIEKEGYIFEI